MVLSLLFAIIFGALTSWWLLRLLINFLQARLLDQPNKRSSHLHPTPRGGGVSFVLASTIVSGFFGLLNFASASDQLALTAAPIFAFPLALIGWFDDLYNIPPGWRYGIQLATAFSIISTSYLRILPFSLLPFVFLLLAVTAVINFTNFMDGLDGLVAGCMAVAMTASATQLSAPLPIWVLIGALLGFLSWNWSPAKVFMGDVGSTFLGAVFAVLVLQASTWSEALALLLVATPLLGDACLCVPRRLMAGQRVFQAHRLHLFQRLHQAGWPHARVSILYIAATAVLAMALLWGGLPWVITLAAVELLMGFWLDQQVAVPFSVASRS